eukprot:8279687-Pyramimonas_sp.AAC.1
MHHWIALFVHALGNLLDGDPLPPEQPLEHPRIPPVADLPRQCHLLGEGVRVELLQRREAVVETLQRG